MGKHFSTKRQKARVFEHEYKLTTSYSGCHDTIEGVSRQKKTLLNPISLFRLDMRDGCSYLETSTSSKLYKSGLLLYRVILLFWQLCLGASVIIMTAKSW